MISAAQIIRQRRSLLACDGRTSIPAERFYRMLARTLPVPGFRGLYCGSGGACGGFGAGLGAINAGWPSGWEQWLQGVNLPALALGAGAVWLVYGLLSGKGKRKPGGIRAVQGRQAEERRELERQKQELRRQITETL